MIISERQMGAASTARRRSYAIKAFLSVLLKSNYYEVGGF
jgi:hypothetical protein